MTTTGNTALALVTADAKQQLDKAGLGDMTVLAAKYGCQKAYLEQVVEKFGVAPVRALETFESEHVERQVTLRVFVSHMENHKVSAEVLTTCFLAQDALGTIPLGNGKKTHRATVPNLVELMKRFPELADLETLVEFAEEAMNWSVQYSLWTFLKRTTEIQLSRRGGVPKTAQEMLEYLKEEADE